jgi:hypothetical protein
MENLLAEGKFNISFESFDNKLEGVVQVTHVRSTSILHVSWVMVWLDF